MGGAGSPVPPLASVHAPVCSVCRGPGVAFTRAGPDYIYPLTQYNAHSKTNQTIGARGSKSGHISSVRDDSTMRPTAVATTAQ